MNCTLFQVLLCGPYPHLSTSIHMHTPICTKLYSLLYTLSIHMHDKYAIPIQPRIFHTYPYICNKVYSLLSTPIDLYPRPYSTPIQPTHISAPIHTTPHVSRYFRHRLLLFLPAMNNDPPLFPPIPALNIKLNIFEYEQKFRA